MQGRELDNLRSGNDHLLINSEMMLLLTVQRASKHGAFELKVTAFEQLLAVTGMDFRIYGEIE